MTNALDTKLLKTASKVVSDICNKPIVYRRFFKGEYDVTAGQTVTPNPIEYRVFALIEGYGRFAFIAGSTVEARDMKVTIPCLQLDFEPMVGDQVTFMGKVWNIITNRPNPFGATTPIMWELQVRCG